MSPGAAGAAATAASSGSTGGRAGAGNGVDLVDYRHVGFDERADGRIDAEPVAQHVEAELGRGDEADVARIRSTARLGAEVGRDPANRDAEGAEERPHPFRVAPGEVVVHRHHVHPPTLEREGDRGDRARQSLALPRGQLHPVAGEQRQGGDQLAPEGALAQRLLRAHADERAEAT
jgi:hypothetical protein